MGSRSSVQNCIQSKYAGAKMVQIMPATLESDKKSRTRHLFTTFKIDVRFNVSRRYLQHASVGDISIVDLLTSSEYQIVARYFDTSEKH